MKKIYLAILFILSFTLFSCTEQIRTRNFGGKMTINVKSGYKVTMATFKESDLWYMIEPMDENYVPKNKQLIESSSFGVMEGNITFIESK